MSLGDEIKALRNKGYSYNEIAKELGCSKGTISYHCGEGQKEKAEARRKKRRKEKPIDRKVENFHAEKTSSFEQSIVRNNNERISGKIALFHSCGSRMKTKYTPRTFSVSEAKELLEERGVCYLTGDPIDPEDSQSYHFDHIKPRSAGGENTIDNLGISSPEANYAKGSMEFEDFIKMCHKIVKRYPDPEDPKPKHERG